MLGWRWRPRSDRVHVGAASRRQRRGHRAAHLHVARANVDADCAAAATTDSLSCNNNGGPLRRGAPATRPPARPLLLPVPADDPAASRHERAHGDMTTSTAAVFTVFNLIDCSRGEEGLGGGIGGRAAADRHGGGCAAGEHRAWWSGYGERNASSISLPSHPILVDYFYRAPNGTPNGTPKARPALPDLPGDDARPDPVDHLHHPHRHPLDRGSRRARRPSSRRA